jgi:uncharacterized protein (TIGR03382 family)
MLQLTRISLVCFGLLAASATSAVADVTHAETIVHRTSTTTSVALNSETVLCSTADYSGQHLKVLIPKLASLTLLDHQNFGAGAPCVSAGACGPGRMPSDVIDPNNPSETVTLNITAVRRDETDVQAQTCETELIERVNVTIRGLEFKHERSVWLGSRALSDCVVGAPDNPADDPGSVEKPESSGCNAAGGSGIGSLLALGLGALVVRRRKRS